MHDKKVRKVRKVRKVTYIRIDYDDGTQTEAHGDDANVIWSRLNACCQAMNYIHGVRYNGPSLKEVPKEAVRS